MQTPSHFWSREACAVSPQASVVVLRVSLSTPSTLKMACPCSAELAVALVSGGRFVSLHSLDTLKFRGPDSTDFLYALQRSLDTELMRKLRVAKAIPTHPFFSRLALVASAEDGACGRISANWATLDGIDDKQLDALLLANVLFVHADETLSFYSRHVASFFARHASDGPAAAPVVKST